MTKSLCAMLVLLALSLSLAACQHGEHNETPVAISALPPAVKATLDRESRGGKVDEVEKDIKNGRTVYSADLTVGGVAWDIAIAEDGTLISKAKEADEKKDAENDKD